VTNKRTFKLRFYNKTSNWNQFCWSLWIH